MVQIPHIRVAELLPRYEVVLLDAYGVLVTLDGPLLGARALIDRLNRSGQSYFMLTNGAARLPENAAVRYQGFGLAIPPERIITSASLLTAYFRDQGLSGRRCRVLGPADSLCYVELAGGRVVGLNEPFDVLVVCDQSGFPFLETVDDTISRLIEMIEAGRPAAMILPNPDLMFPTGRGFGITSGSIALVIEAALALRYPNRPELRFARLGKPYAAIFEEAARRAGSRAMVMIGDQLETDIRGAQDFGIDSALVMGGVVSTDAIGGDQPQPTWLLDSLEM
ncbi:MAG: HAD hydrolase-like protein [Hydrogenophilaceae bacterium]|nr:HAD hydrolase-like protein [Hydrogenophilaceae bacterium]